MENVATIPEFRDNGHGVKIKVCCASCAFMAVDDRLLRKGDDESSTRRFCIHRGEIRKNSDGCPEWKMRSNLSFTPKGDGTIKSKDYLTDWLDKTLSYRQRMGKAHEVGDYLAEARLRDEYEEYTNNRKQQDK